MKEPGKIATNILGIIAADVIRIKDDFKQTRLDVETALTLTRYLKAVYEAKEDQSEELKRHSEKLAKLSNKELKDMALEILQKKQDPAPNVEQE